MASSGSSQSLAWLREAASATKLFTGSQPSLSSSQTAKHRDPWRVDDDDDEDGTHYLPMASRGDEIFAVVENQIRWMDLARAKEHWEEQRRASRGNNNDNASSSTSYPPYRTLRVKLHEKIRALVVSPNEEMMAVVTEHNVVVVVLPDPSSLGLASLGTNTNNNSNNSQKEKDEQQQPVRVKTHTIGPTTHVVSQSPVVKALWHPLGAGGNCLVTVTASAVVRLWELDRRTLSSFSEPSLALDLRKLRHAKSQSADVGAGDMTSNRTFSTDDAEMEVSAACFGAGAGAAQAFEWSAATLWLAMAEGDVYALCPLLPTRFEPDDDGTITALCELKEAEKQAVFEQSDAKTMFGGRDRARLQAQCAWLAELREQYDNFESYDNDGSGDGGPDRRVYVCPKSQGMAPRLQGPFVIVPNDVQDELTPCDLHVVGASTAASIVNTLANNDDSDDSDVEPADLGTSFSTVCILSTDGRVYVCIDVDGVEPQWLPRKRDVMQRYGDKNTDDDAESTPELLLLEGLDTLRPEDAEYGRLPAFTASTDADDYKFYVTNARGIYEFSLEPWVHELEAELQSSGADGLKFRTQVLSRGPGTERRRILKASGADTGDGGSIAAPLLIGTSSLGRLLLTVQSGHASAVSFLDPDADEEPAALTWKPGADLSGAGGAPTEIRYDRDVYVPAAAFAASSELAHFTRRHVDPRHARVLHDEIRLSPAALSVMTDAHRVLSRETTALNDAAAQLFRRCERLHDEFRHQIRQARQLAERVREFADVAEDGDDGEGEDKENAKDDGKEGAGTTRKELVNRRIQDAKARNEALVARYDQLKRRLAHAGGRPISTKERAWIAEVRKVQAAAGDADDDVDADDTGSRKMLLRRYQEVRNIARELLDQAKEHGVDAPAATGIAPSAAGHSKVPPDIRRHKMAQMQEMLDRETALVDSATEKLVRLGLMGQG